MAHQHNHSDILAYFQSRTSEQTEFQTAAIERAYTVQTPKQTLPIKVLSVLGGLLAAIAFFGFLLISGWYYSNILLAIYGVIAIGTAIILSRQRDNILLDTLSVSSLIIGFILIGTAIAEWNFPEKKIPLCFIFLAILCFALAKNYMLSFVCTLIIHGSIIAYLLNSKQANLLPIYVALIGIAVCYMHLKEAKLLTSSIAIRYNPVKIALIFAFVSGLAFLRAAFLGAVHPYYLLATSITCILLILYLTRHILLLMAVERTTTKVLAYLLILLTLVPTAITPGISGALLLLLLGFLTNYRTGFVVAAISLLYFIGQCYYDLQYSLLTKSILLFASGVFFLILYLFIAKYHEQHQKI